MASLTPFYSTPRTSVAASPAPAAAEVPADGLVLEFTGTDRLTGVRFKSTKEDATERYAPCDGVFEYIGFSASSQAFANLGIVDRTGCIQADARMGTSLPGIFGAGDITVKHLRQIVTACSDGAVAANSAAAYVESLK